MIFLFVGIECFSLCFGPLGRFDHFLEEGDFRRGDPVHLAKLLFDAGEAGSGQFLAEVGGEGLAFGGGDGVPLVPVVVAGVGKLVLEQLIFKSLAHCIIDIAICIKQGPYCKIISVLSFVLYVELFFDLCFLPVLLLLLHQHLLVLHHDVTVVLLEFLFPAPRHSFHQLGLDQAHYQFEGRLGTQCKFELGLHLIDQDIGVVFNFSLFGDALLSLFQFALGLIHILVDLRLFPGIDHFAFLEGDAVVD